MRYTFTFWEGFDGYQAYARSGQTQETAGTGGQASAAGEEASSEGQVWHTVVSGENLWKIAGDYGVTLTSVIALNPQIKNPNLIYPGEKVRLK